jgi:hypothetical protein
MKPSISLLPAISAPVILSLLFMSVGCKKNSSTPAPTTGTMTGSFNGTAFQPSLVLGLDVSNTLTVAGLQVKGGDSIGVSISFEDNIPINTVLNFSNVEVSYSDSKGLFDFESSNSPSHGSVTILGLDTKNLLVAGSFSGVLYDTGTDSVVVTNGQFNSTYKTF